MADRMLFEKGARVAMVGDSITHSGMAVAYIQEYYLAHLPEREVKVYNLGIGGDSAAGACRRIDEIMSVKPTEAVVMFGVNDMGVPFYGADPSDKDKVERAERHRLHVEATVRLVKALCAEGLKVTLCSSVGRDEETPGTEGYLSFGATEALLEMYRDDLAAIGPGLLKGTVDYLTPFRALQRELVAIGGPSLFAPDRTHPSELGQKMMARILLRAQGLPVTLPTAGDLADGWCERVLPPALRERRSAGLRWRDLHWVYPHQADRTPGMALAERIAFWAAEAKREDLPAYFINMYKNYVEHAEREEEYFAEYMRRTDALYPDIANENKAIVKEGLRI